MNTSESLPEKEKAENKECEKRDTRHRVLTIVGIVLCVILVPILVLNMYLIIKSYTEPDKVPSVFGVLPMLVSDDSMEPDIMKGDLVIAKTTLADDIKEGDVILFFDTNKKNKGKVLTQRVVKVIVDDQGAISWETERIGTPAEGEENTDAVFTVPEKNLVGRWEGTRIPALGGVAIFMQTIPGMLICVALPVLLLVMYDFLREKKADKKKADETAALMAELEALRALQKANENPSAENAPATEIPIEETPAADPPNEEPPTEGT